jgi:tetratricopeptide (TPR) repeat protein
MQAIPVVLLPILFAAASVPVGQNAEEEIRQMVANAPVAEATAVAEGEEGLVAFAWIMALARTGRVEEARAAGRAVGDKFTEKDRLGAIAFGLGRADRIAEVRAVVRSLPAPQAGQVLIQSLIIAKEFDQALAEARKLENESERGQQMTEIVTAMVRANKISEAIRAADEIKGPMAAIYVPEAQGAIAESLARSGQVAEALAAARKILVPASRELVLQQVAETLAQVGRTDDALAIAAESQGPLSRASVWLRVAKALASAGKTEEAVALARKIDNGSMRLQALSAVVVALNHTGAKDQAAKVLQEAMAAAAACKPERQLWQAFAVLSRELADGGMVPESLTALQESKDENERGWALLAIVKALAKAGRYDEALEKAHSIKPMFGQRTEAITDVVKTACAAGKATPKILAGAGSTLLPSDQLAVVQGLAEAGRAEEALAVAREIKDADMADLACEHVAVAFARAQDYRQARLVADRSASPMIRLGIYGRILMLYTDAQDPALKTRLTEAREL